MLERVVMNNPRYPVSEDLAMSLTVEHWSCLRGFSSMLPEGRSQLARILQQATISADHARAVAKTFDELCPTPREISETAERLRDSFEHKPAPEEEWRRQGLTADPVFSAQLLARMGKPDQYDQLRWQGIRDAIKAIGDPKYDQKFWTPHLKWAEDHYPEDVAAIRAGHEPQPAERRRGPVVSLAG
jgi:hypothetical protein